MNILYLINYLGGGGTESYIYSLISRLKADNKIYLAYNQRADGYEKFKDLGIELIELPMNSFYDIKAAKSLNNLCQKLDIDVIHSHFLRENAISVMSKFFGHKASLINTRHMLLVNSGLARQISRLVTSYDDYIIAVSKSVENLLEEELGRRKNIKLIYTGVDLDTFKSASYDFRTREKIDPETIVITSTARFSPEKGHEFIIRSLARLLDSLEDKNIRLVLIGDGPLLNDMKDLAQELQVQDYISFLGYERDVASVLHGSNIYLLGSETEAFGISILEAMACSLPVVSTNSGGTQEILGENQDFGLLVDYGDTNQLVEALLRLIRDPDLRKFYGDQGYKLVVEKFSLDKTIEETYKLYLK